MSTALYAVTHTGELLEAIWWLIQGVETGYFPQEEAKMVWTRHAQIIESQFREYKKSESGEFFAPRLIYDLGVHSASATILEQRASGKPTERAVDQGIAISNAFAQDVLANRCLATLLFASDDEWGVVMRGDPGPDQVDAVLNQPEGENERATYAIIIAGWVNVLEHMAASQNHFGYYAEPLAPLLPRYGQIEAWRLNFSNERFKNRSNLVNQKLASLISKGLETEVMAGLNQDFKQVVERLKRDWVRNHPFYLSIEADPLQRRAAG